MLHPAIRRGSVARKLRGLVECVARLGNAAPGPLGLRTAIALRNRWLTAGRVLDSLQGLAYGSYAAVICVAAGNGEERLIARCLPMSGHATYNDAARRFIP